MAQTEGISSRSFGDPSGKQYILTRSNSLSQGAGDNLEHSPVQETATSACLDDHEDHYDPNHGKQSILVKVKDQARKWRQMLANKRQGHEGSDGTTPPRGVSLNGNDVDDPEYHGAPMYGSEMATDTCYRCPPSQPLSACQFHGADKNSDVAHVELEMKESNDVHKQKELNGIRAVAVKKPVSEIRVRPDHPSSSGAAENKPLREMAAEMIMPACAMASRTGRSRKQGWVRGASMKEYLMQKLEPREEHRALSQVITEAVSPRTSARQHDHRAAAQAGVVEKVKGAVRSLLGNEGPQDSPIPVSTNPFSEIVDVEGRTIQAYIN